MSVCIELEIQNVKNGSFFHFENLLAADMYRQIQRELNTAAIIRRILMRI